VGPAPFNDLENQAQRGSPEIVNKAHKTRPGEGFRQRRDANADAGYRTAMACWRTRFDA
jgi:hypothetical protein